MPKASGSVLTALAVLVTIASACGAGPTPTTNTSTSTPVPASASNTPAPSATPAGVFTLFPSEPKTVDDYMKVYGGWDVAYNRILAMTDCADLQEVFDLADENQAVQEPGTPLYKMSIGYMTAANDRMKEIGCTQ